MICVFSIFLLITSSIACHYAYLEKKKHILSSMDRVYSQINQEYENILDNFWQIYMPIFESDSSIYKTFQNYFSNTEAKDLSPLEKRTLSNNLNQLRIRDDRIEWIALYSDNRHINYIKYSDNTDIKILTDDFPFLTNINSKTSKMEIYEAKEIVRTHDSIKNFAICGGVPIGMGNGKIIIGYRLNTFEEAKNLQSVPIPSMRYYILANDQLLYDSLKYYDLNNIYIPSGNQEGLHKSGSDILYVKSDFTGNNTSLIVSTVLWKEVFLAAHKDTPWILAITLSFMIVSLFVYISMNISVSKEVTIIREGLNWIADNHLDYRLPTDFKQGGLPEIAQNINDMSYKLNENIKKSYYFELKQKDAQLAHLQATFNPHFLYNTLEMLRSKSYANGDEETAELISDLASIFRSFVGAKTFITLKEELTFTKKYLALLSTRYGDKVEIRYDMDSSLLNYGIINNTFQLLIENYFIHGYNANDNDNLIQFTGTSLDDTNMLLTMEDNGFGMSENDISALNLEIEKPIRHGKESYGLKNLNQRLKLFYGPDYGLCIQGNDYGGLTVQIKIRKMHVEEYEERKRENIS